MSLIIIADHDLGGYILSEMISLCFVCLVEVQARHWKENTGPKLRPRTELVSELTVCQRC